MSEDRKIMIKALVYRYTDPGTSNSNISAPWAADFIENKGDGQIFLLHGSPGVGKTYVCTSMQILPPILKYTNMSVDRGQVSERISDIYVN